MTNSQHIVITGGNSGIGAALALYYAAPGYTITLTGRNEKRLEMVAAKVRAAGAEPRIEAVDVIDATKMASAINRADEARPIDLLIANAGISAGTGGNAQEPTEQIRQIFATNIDGVINTVEPAVTRMLTRGRGQVGIISSLAGLRGLPSSPAYSASKAAVRLYGEGIRGVLGDRGIKVSVICPGFIRTPMTDVNDYYMPAMMEPEEAARRIARGLARNKSRIAFPRRIYWPLRFVACLPVGWTDPFFKRMPAKPKS